LYKISGNKSESIDPVSFAELGLQESDIEELLRRNIEMISEDEKSVLIVGQQVRNVHYGRSDLTAIDNNGDIVLIEIKRDRRDIESRKESFEFQAIRYAASYATIETPDELVTKIYAPYIEKYREEFENDALTSFELGRRKLNEFLEDSGAGKRFNNKQRIILVASDFDEQTLSAVAWLNSNNVDMSCYKLIPYKIDQDVYLSIEKVLPLDNYDDYYVTFLEKVSSKTAPSKSVSRRLLPKIDTMLKWGVVKEGDIIKAKDYPDEGSLLGNGNVLASGQEISLQKWLKELYGWSSIQTYVFAIHKESGKVLSEIRQEYMEKLEEENI